MRDFFALIQMQTAGVFDDLRLMEIRERSEAREAQCYEP